MDAIIAKGGKRYACEGCKAGKKACDGIYPCGRCSARGIECVFLGKAKERLQFSAVNAGQGGDAKSPAQASRSTGSPLSPTSSGKRKRAESEPAVDDALSRALSRPRLFQTSGPLPSPWNPTNLVQVAAADRGHQAMDPRYLLPGHSAPAWQHGYPTHPYNPPNPSHAPQITNLLNHPYQSPHPHSQPDSSHSPATAPSPSEDQLLELWHPSPAAPPSPGKPTISSLLWSPDPPQPHSPYSESGRQPGSWYPPVPTPPFVVSRPVPRADGMPGEEVLRGLAWEFFEDYHPTFPILHRATFFSTPPFPPLLLSLTLLSSVFSTSPAVSRARNPIQVSLFLRCTQELRYWVESLPSYPLENFGEAHDAGMPETVVALGFVALWAYRRGYATLQQSVVQLALRLARRYALHLDPGDSGSFGMPDIRSAWIRREFRRKAWATVWSLTEFISSVTGREVEDLAAEGRRHRIPPSDRTWELDSAHPAWTPAEEFRPRIHELVDWMDLDGPDRQAGFRFFMDGLARRSLVVIYLFGFLRLRTNQFLALCKERGVSPVSLADGELKSRAERIGRNITDILEGLPAPLKEAEADGNAAGMLDYFAQEVHGVPNARKSLFARVLYLSQIRLFKLETTTSYGVLGFQDMAKLASEWGSGVVFQQCIADAIVYTRCLASLLRFHPSLSYISISTGLFPLKIGAFHLAILKFYRAHGVASEICQDVERDLRTCLEFLKVVAGNNPSAEWWASRIVDTLAQMADSVLGSSVAGRSGSSSLASLVEGPTSVEVNQVHLRTDAPDAPAPIVGE